MNVVIDAMKKTLQNDIHSEVNVSEFTAPLSAYLASSFSLYIVRVLGKKIIVAEPVFKILDTESMLKQALVLSKQLGNEVNLYLPEISTVQRRLFVENAQGFISKKGDYYLPSLALSFSAQKDALRRAQGDFTPIQQAVFLYCLYSGSQAILQVDIQKTLGFSSGSISGALSLFVDLRILDLVVDGKTGRRKSYFIPNKREYYLKGIEYFGSPVKEVFLMSRSAKEDDWLKSGLTALAVRSSLVLPKRMEYAVSSKVAADFTASFDSSAQECVVQVLRYDPTPFAASGCVDPLTMMLTIEDVDERVSLALNEAMEGYEWYQG